MKIIMLLLFIFFPIIGFTQIFGEDEIYLKGDLIEAKFNGGGLDKFADFINKNFDYSKVTKPGLLETTFAIDEQGNVKKIRITKILDIESATELIRVLKICPKWEPAKRDGKPISIDIKYPMVFKAKVKNKSVGKLDIIPSKTDSLSNDADNKVYESASIEIKPTFNGGVSKFLEFIAQNYQTPLDEGLYGKILVSFIVEKDGSLDDIMVIKDIGYGTGAEAIRVLKKCPKWNPAKQNGVPVRCEFKLPILIGSKTGKKN
ncbi:MAG: energy transducer TonB [Flavobacterium sp.]|nr:energy transducer TonB [Flavobacterium sp.]